MHRRDYLRAAVGAGLAGLATPAAAGGSPSTRPTREREQGYEPLGRIDVTNDLPAPYQATEAATTPDGGHAFVSRLDGFEVVDLTDPTEPEVVHTATGLLEDEADEPLTGILDLKYDRERLFVAAGFNAGFPGFAVYDVSEPTAPTLSATYETGRSVHNGYLSGSFAYLTARTGIEIIDLRPDEPEQLSSWSITDYDEGYADVPVGLRTAHDLYVQGDRLYVANWDAGSWVVDVSDPADPTHAGHVGAPSPADLADAPDRAGLEPPGNDHYVQPSDDGTLLFVGAESWNAASNDEENGDDDPGGPSGVTVWDIADLGDPVELATIDPPPVPDGEDATRGGYWTTAHNFDVVGDTLYTSWYRGGVKVHDVSDPAAPTELAAWADGENASFWGASAGVPGEFFVASSMTDPADDGPGGFYVFPDPAETEATDATDAATATPTPTSTSTDSPAGTPTDAATATEPAATPTAGGAEPGTGTETAAGPATDPPDGESTGTETTRGAGPGFGALAALAALGAGAYRFVRDDD